MQTRHRRSTFIQSAALAVGLAALLATQIATAWALSRVLLGA